MTLQRRSFNFLPAYLQTDRNNLELAVTDDLVYEPEQARFVSGFIGDTHKLSEQDLARTPRLIESSTIRQKYQFSIGVAQLDPDTQNFVSGAFYDDLVNHLALNGAIVTDPNRLFTAFYYAWSPPVDYDKLVNPSRYYWTGPGNADLNGEYVTKEAAGSKTILHRFNGTSLVSFNVTVVNGLPGSGSLNQVVEDASTTDRLFYIWNGTAWGVLNFQPAADTTVKISYFPNDYIYVCRTGSHFNRPVVWVYRPNIGRWISVPVVINIDHPEIPETGMIWEDATVPPARVLRIWDGNQWQILDTGTTDPFTGDTITYTRAAGPSGTPTNTTYLFDTRALSAVDTWSAQNWWRALNDLSLSDQGALSSDSQGARPIVELWGNIEPATGNTRSQRNQFPLFNLYAVSPSSFDIEDINPTNFPGLNTASLTATGNYVGGSVVSTIFQYARSGGLPDSILGFHYDFGSDGTPLFHLDLERLPITISGTPLQGYRYYRDTATGFVHSIWERTNDVLLQLQDSDGLYEIPKNLKFNPDHIITTEISRSNYINHLAAVIQSQVDFSGTPYGQNNYRYSEKDLTIGATMIDPEESVQRVLAILQTNKLDIPDSIRQMSRDYNKTMFRFLQQLNNYWNDGTLSTVTDTLVCSATQAVDAVLSQIFMNRNSEFPYFYSSMGSYVETRIISGTVSIFDTTPLSIFIPNSAAQIGASPAYVPEIFLDDDGVTKIRGHDGSLIPSYGDARDDVILDLETRFYNSVPDYQKLETTSFSARFASTFNLDDYYGNFIPNLTAGKVTDIVADYNAIMSPVTNARLYSSNQQAYATWNGTRWVTQSASVNDVFQNLTDSNYYIFNGFYAKQIITFNRNFNFDYSENEFRAVLQREFERWIVVHSLDFTTNNDFDVNDPFTWNFSSAGIEGDWRGIYRRLYRTVRPHSHPWEIAGYSVRPSWWFTSYVPTSFAPDGTPRYTNTHLMWADLQAGIVNPLTALTLASHAMVAPIPVDVSGNLIDPIAAGIVDEQALTPSSLGDDWAFGDGGPIEQKFYDSYYFQFANALAGYLMKTTLFVDRTWSEFYRQIGNSGTNILWNAPHIVFNDTLSRPPAANVPTHLSLDATGNFIQNPGLNSWIAEYTNIVGFSANIDFANAIKYTQASLGWKTSGFINPKRTRFELLNGDEVPSEDINVVLHQGPSVNEYFQSGIIIVRDTDGFRLFGTDVLNPYFTVDVGAKPIAGGSIESTEGFTYDGARLHPVSDPSLTYTRASITVAEITIPPVLNDTAIFSILINGFRVPDKYIQRLDSTHFAIDQVLKLTEGDSIVASVLTTVSNPSTQLGSFTVNGTQITYFATGTGNLVNYPYGSLFQTLSDVVNILIGYGRFLASQGWVFERLTNGILRDWLGAAKTFAIWSTELTIRTRGNPVLMKGEVFQYSAMGRRAEFNAPFGMVLGAEEIRNGSYGVVDVEGKPIRANHLSVVSTDGNMVVTSDTTDIFGLRLYLNEVQHVVFFPNTTTFADVIYEPAFGLAQDAMIVDTYRTTNWAGRMEAPGFLINGGNLYPNWEKQVNDITRYYNRFNPPDDPILTGMARNTFGYIPQDYMRELAIDDRNRFNFFHGSLKSKGTFQPYEAFIRGTTIGSDNVRIYEDWAWKFERYGDMRKQTVLFTVNETDFVDIFQTIVFDELVFAFNFVGDENTSCFNVPERFDPPKAVVTKNGLLQAFGVDYQMVPTSDGYSVCFTLAPLRDDQIVVSLNDVLVHGVQDTFYRASSANNFIEFQTDVRSENVLLAVNGRLAVANTDYSAALNTLFYTQGVTAYGMVFGDLGADLFRQLIYTGDGFTTEFETGIGGQTVNTILLSINGLLKRPGIDYVIDNVTEAPLSLVQTTFTPSLNDRIFIIATNNVALIRTSFANFTANGSQSFFSIPGVPLTNYREVLVAANGLIQTGAIPGQSVPYDFIVSSGGIQFNTAPAFGSQIIIYGFLDTATSEQPPLEDDRIIHIPQFSPPQDDPRWVIPPQQDTYRDLPYRFPVFPKTELVDFNKYRYTASIVDQDAKDPAVTMFHWDPARDLHEPFALSNVDYKVPFDPARYNQGPNAEAPNGLVWGEQQVGKVWWDTSVLSYNDYESYLPDFIEVTRQWGKLKYCKATIERVNDVVTVTTIDPKTNIPTAHGLVEGEVVIISGADQPTYNGTINVTVSSDDTFTFLVTEAADTPGTGNIIVKVGLVNCYEWVASPVPPQTWDVFVQGQSKAGFNLYSGTVYNASNASYATREVWDINGNVTTTYYFWVENNTRLIPGKDIAVLDIAGRLESPAQYEVPFFAIIDPGKIFVFTGDTVPQDNYAIEITYYWYELPTHIEWILFGEGEDFMPVPVLVTDKLLDSLLGTDVHGNPVPNITLPPDEKYGTCFFPAQIVFQNVQNALVIYLDALNTLLMGIDINTLFDLFKSFDDDELTNINPNGYWSRTTWWDPSVDHSFVYDTVVSTAELTFRTNERLYAAGDIVKLIESDQVDAFSTTTQVASYLQYDGTNWNLIGIVNHAVEINSNVVNSPTIFRDLFQLLKQDISKLQLNGVIFALLFEMLRQNPNCDWFFKTSYIDIHSSQNIPMTPYVFPDQANLIREAVLNLKPYRTKLRDEALSLIAPLEPVPVRISETEIDRFTLIFDRVACNLNDENAWDTIPWDATATYPETELITIPFTGNGVQTCFFLPEAVPIEDIFVFINGHIQIPFDDFLFYPGTFDLCFNVVPGLGDQITVIIDGPFVYISNFEYSFQGNGVTDTETLPDKVAEAHVTDVFSTWNGVHQIPTTDFIVQITSDTDVVYNVVPTSEIVVNGIVFGGTLDAIFAETVHIGDGSTVLFNTSVQQQTLDSVIVEIDGVWQTPGVDYLIDNVNAPPFSLVLFVTPPAVGANVVIYALNNPGFVDTSHYTYSGDGASTFFTVPGLTSTHPPLLFVQIDGIQQNAQVGDFVIVGTGIVFAVAPASSTIIEIYAVGLGVGHRIAAGTYPQTIQWDWAYWNYADLGRQEFDFAAFFLGDDITESFTLTIPQQSSSLYNVVVKYFQNGLPTTLEALGLTQSITKLTTGVVVFLSDSLPSDTYGAVYVSRGFYQGLEPTFGYQDPNGIVFSPIDSTYEHFFARLISATFDPSTVEDGCPNNTPEERVQTAVEDLWTVVCKTYTQHFPDLEVSNILGVSGVSQVGTFAFQITTNPALTGVAAYSQSSSFVVMNQPPPVNLVGIGTTADVGSLIVQIETAGGDQSLAEFGSFDFQIDNNPGLPGQQTSAVVGSFDPTNTSTFSEFVTAGTGTFTSVISSGLTGLQVVSQFGAFQFINVNVVGVQAVTQRGNFGVQTDDGTASGQEATSAMGSFEIQIAQSLGVQAFSQAGNLSFQEDTSPDLSGVAVTAQFGSFVIRSGEGLSTDALVGTFLPAVDKTPLSVSATSQIGTMTVDPKSALPIGQSASAEIGSFTVAIGF